MIPSPPLCTGWWWEEVMWATGEASIHSAHWIWCLMSLSCMINPSLSQRFRLCTVSTSMETLEIQLISNKAFILSCIYSFSLFTPNIMKETPTGVIHCMSFLLCWVPINLLDPHHSCFCTTICTWLICAWQSRTQKGLVFCLKSPQLRSIDLYLGGFSSLLLLPVNFWGDAIRWENSCLSGSCQLRSRESDTCMELVNTMHWKCLNPLNCRASVC